MTALIDEVEAAQYVCLSRSFMRQARVRGTGPVFRKLGRAVRYLVSDLDAWIEENGRLNTIQHSISKVAKASERRKDNGKH